MTTDRENALAEMIESLKKEVRRQERVAIFVDNSNIFGAITDLPQLYGKRLDYVKLKDFLADGRTVSQAFFYYSEPPFPKGENPEVLSEARDALKKRKAFYRVLHCAGYRTICLPQRVRHIGGANGGEFLEKGLDTELVYDMCALSRDGNYDTFILAAGAEDYARPVERIRQDTGIRVEVAFFEGANCSYRLQEAASHFIDLGKHLDGLFFARSFSEMEVK